MLDILFVFSLTIGYFLLSHFIRWCDYEIKNN